MKRNKLILVTVWLTVCLMVLSACGRKSKYENAAEVLTDVLENEPVLNTEYEDLSDSEKISYLIMEQVSIEIVEDKKAFAKVGIKYPDVATVLVSMIQSGIYTDTDKIYSDLVDMLEAEKISKVYVETEVEYDDYAKKSILWNDTVSNAFSGGLYELTIQGGEK